MKKSRQNESLNLISSCDIGTQEELCAKLLENGIDVTQATISRDIRELKLTKVVGDNGKPKYVSIIGEALKTDKPQFNSVMMKSAILSVDYASNIIVIITNAGMAPALGSYIDSMEIPEMLGTIAGDDTLMCVVRTESEARKICAKQIMLLKQ